MAVRPKKDHRTQTLQRLGRRADLPPSHFLRDGAVELLALDGQDPPTPGRPTSNGSASSATSTPATPPTPNAFCAKPSTGRPRTEGLLLRLHLSDGDTVEGLAANDVSLVSGQGLFLTPPDAALQHSAPLRSPICRLRTGSHCPDWRIETQTADPPEPPTAQESLF